jgi:hypothetical protein
MSPLHAVLLLAPPGAGKTTFVGALSQFSYRGYRGGDGTIDSVVLTDRTGEADRNLWEQLRQRTVDEKPRQFTEEPAFYHVDLNRLGTTTSFLLLDYPGGTFFSSTFDRGPRLEADLSAQNWGAHSQDSLTVVIFVNHPLDPSGTRFEDMPDRLYAALRNVHVHRVLLYLARADEIWPTKDFLKQLRLFNQVPGRMKMRMLLDMLLTDESLVAASTDFFARRTTRPAVAIMAGSSYGALADGKPNRDPRTGALARPGFWTPIGVMPVLWFAGAC